MKVNNLMKHLDFLCFAKEWNMQHGIQQNIERVHQLKNDDVRKCNCISDMWHHNDRAEDSHLSSQNEKCDQRLINKKVSYQMNGTICEEEASIESHQSNKEGSMHNDERTPMNDNDSAPPLKENESKDDITDISQATESHAKNDSTPTTNTPPVWPYTNCKSRFTN